MNIYPHCNENFYIDKRLQLNDAYMRKDKNIIMFWQVLKRFEDYFIFSRICFILSIDLNKYTW